MRSRFGRFRTKTRTAAAAAVLALGASLVAPLPMAAHAAPVTDYCQGRCSDILPPGENGNATLAQILLNQIFGTQPEHAEDQLGPYANLAGGYQNLTDATINNFFNDASFGVPAGQVASTTSPAAT